MASSETHNGLRDVHVKGLGVSPGVAVGRVLRLDERDIAVGMPVDLETRNPRREIIRLRKAITRAREQILEIKERVASELGRGHAYFFEAHLLMLEDRELLRDVERVIRDKGIKAEWAVKTVMDRMLQVYAHVKDDYLRERGSDIEDVARRVIRALSGGKAFSLARLQTDVVVVAKDLPPSAVAELDLGHVLGFATNEGGFTSHTSIIARSLGIPAVVGLPDLTSLVSSGDTMVVDGSEGCTILNPSKAVMRRYIELREQQRRVDPVELAPPEARTTDGHRCTLRANIELPSEVDSVTRYGAQGIGLYRSEFLFLNTLPDLPSEDEQVAVFERLAAVAGDDGATIRSFDLGGDKLTLDGFESERNPALGLRALRLSLRALPVFRVHLRAILRASVKGKLRILLPMVSKVSEVEATRALLEECKDQLRAEGRPFDSRIPLGIMIEVPSAVIIADHLAAQCDFFSLGTNDLIQFLLGVDRSNPHVADIYDPLHPAVLRSLKRVADIAHQAGIPVDVCGEVASSPLFVVVLLGLGLDHFSLTPPLIPLIKRVINSVSFQEAREIADELLTMRSARAIECHLVEQLERRFPAFFANWNG